jgi:hypothetical protein
MAQTKQASGRPWRLLGLALAAGLAAILIGLAACGDDDSAGDNKNTAGATKTAGATGSESTRAPGDSSNGGGGDGGTKLKELSKDWSQVTAKVSYTFSSTSQNKTTDTTMTLYSRPPDSRIDFDLGNDGQSIFINTGGKSYVCTKLKDVGQCFLSPSSDDSSSPLPFFGDFADPDTIDKTIAGLAGISIDTFDDKIAGQNVDCFKASGNVANESGETSWCFTDDGILLSSSFSGSDSKFEMKATQFSKSLSDKDFEPPFTVTDITGRG